jgi:hypothetical protein
MAGIFGLLMSGAGVLKDQYFNLTSLLLPGNGTNGKKNNDFVDSSSNNFSITPNGDVTQGTFSPFSQTGWGSTFSGSNQLTLPSALALAPEAGQFCIEFWIYPTASWGSTDKPIFVAAGSGGLWVGWQSTAFVLRAYGVTNHLTYATAPSLNTWTHVAICRNSGNTTSMYFNGFRVATGTVTQNFAQAVSYIASDSAYGAGGAALLMASSLSNLRLVKGSSVYDPTQSTITVPTSPLTAITNTTLLICQSNRFIDNSTANSGSGWTVTPNNSPSVTPFSPFAPTSSYSAAAVGGSGYFDGSGDYLTAPDNAAWDVGSSNFTIEGWFYPTGSPAQPILIGQWTSSYSWVMLLSNDSNRYIRGILYNGSAFSDYVSTAPLQLNAWNHCAFVRESNTVSLYLNGSRVLTNTFTGSVATSTSAVSLGANSSGADPYLGYMSSTRVVVGTALYSGTTYTVPTAPLTAVSGTQLLLNFTNGGVIDATAKNVLETESTAQISSSIAPKWGSTSIKFNGSSDYLRLAPQNLLNFGTGDFTIEAWVYTTDNTTLQAIFTTAADTVSTNNDWGVLLDIGASGAGTFRGSFYSGTTSYTASASSVVSNNTWTHVAFVRESGNIAVYYGTSGTGNRSSTTSANVAPNFSSSWTPKIGYAQSTSTRFFNGYIQYLRISNRARYTGSTYTVPTAPFPVQ